ncbi:MAG: YybH family protein [Oligoflexus sp.]
MQPKERILSLFKAIEKKDLNAVQSFLPTEGPLAVILNDGSLIDDVEDFTDFFKEWFHEDEWKMTHDLVFIEESPEMAFGIMDGEYSSKDEEGKDFSVNVLTTCIMRKVDGKWVVVHFQQTEGETDED